MQKMRSCNNHKSQQICLTHGTLEQNDKYELKRRVYGHSKMKVYINHGHNILTKYTWTSIPISPQKNL